MTNDEKAKAYDEALELARKIHSGEGVDAAAGWSTLETIFPQLRESEDERIRKWLVDYFSSIKATVWIHRDITCEQILDWLEKQKPAEWSEEDADILNCCISSIEEAKENRYAYKETDGDTSYDREINWLKSLRPSWKPNEEQMNRLVSIVVALRKDYCDDMADFLASLYEQLKKL